jgi:hypothetical protein
MARVTSDARARPQEEDTTTMASAPEETPAPETGATGTDAAAEQERRPGRRPARGDDEDGAAAAARRPSLPLVPVLAVLLVLLLAGVCFLWFTRPAKSSVRTDDYVEILQAARSGVVDMTSFDYLTLDDDLEQIRRETTGDLKKEAVDQLDSRRKQITDTQATVNTEVVGAGVTSASPTSGTVLLVIQSTQKSSASQQAEVLRYRIRVDLKKQSGRWLLSGIAGTGTGNNG